MAFAPGRHRYPRRFARHVLDLTRAMSMSDVARHLGVSWNVVTAILRMDLERRFRRPKLRGLRRIAIDEVSIERGHGCLAIVLDLDAGAVVFVGKGKGAAALDPLRKRLRRFGARIEVVGTDMSQAYIRAIRNPLPDTTLAFDRFHVVKLMNDKLSDKLEDAREESTRPEQAHELNAPLVAACYLKEALRRPWSQSDKGAVARFLDGWIERGWATGFR